MTKSDIQIPQDFRQLSDQEMLEIAFKLNDLEPGAGGVMPESFAQWAVGNVQILSGFEAFMVLTFITLFIAFGLPSFIQYMRSLFSPKRTRNKA